MYLSLRKKIQKKQIMGEHIISQPGLAKGSLAIKNKNKMRMIVGMKG